MRFTVVMYERSKQNALCFPSIHRRGNRLSVCRRLGADSPHNKVLVVSSETPESDGREPLRRSVQFPAPMVSVPSGSEAPREAADPDKSNY